MTHLEQKLVFGFLIRFLLEVYVEILTSTVVNLKMVIEFLLVHIVISYIGTRMVTTSFLFIPLR